jgi:hypothetical protein
VRTPVIYDTRNILSGQAVREKGFTYLGIGRSLMPRKHITAMANGDGPESKNQASVELGSSPEN